MTSFIFFICDKSASLVYWCQIHCSLAAWSCCWRFMWQLYVVSARIFLLVYWCEITIFLVIFFLILPFIDWFLAPKAIKMFYMTFCCCGFLRTNVYTSFQGKYGWCFPSPYNANQRTWYMSCATDWWLLFLLYENQQCLHCDRCQQQCKCSLCFQVCCWGSQLFLLVYILQWLRLFPF